MNVQRTAPNTIIFNGHTISLPMRIIETLALKDRVIVLVDTRYWADTDPELSRNVYCYGADGKLLWQIESSGEARVEDEIVEMYLGYVDILYDAEKDKLEILGVDWEFVIDKDTGRIIAYDRRDRF